MKSQKEVLFGSSKSFAHSNRGQLAAVIIIVLLVAAIGGFIIFSDKRAGEASRTLAAAKYTTQPTQPSGPIYARGDVSSDNIVQTTDVLRTQAPISTKPPQYYPPQPAPGTTTSGATQPPVMAQPGAMGGPPGTGGTAGGAAEVVCPSKPSCTETAAESEVKTTVYLKGSAEYNANLDKAIRMAMGDIEPSEVSAKDYPDLVKAACGKARLSAQKKAIDCLTAKLAALAKDGCYYRPIAFVKSAADISVCKESWSAASPGEKGISSIAKFIKCTCESQQMWDP